MKRIGLALSLILAAPLGVPAAGPVALDDLGSRCLETPLLECFVLTAGYINADGGEDEGAPLIAWQTQTGFTPEAGVSGGFVLFRYDADGWHVLDSGIEGWRYAPPVFNEADILHIAGYSGGTGAFNVDRLYRLETEGGERRWRRIDMEQWFAAVDDLLPEGLEIWKGVAYDFRNAWGSFVARTPLWQDGDANCCPTGADAEIMLEIEGDRLIATSVRLLPPLDEEG